MRLAENDDSFSEAFLDALDPARNPVKDFARRQRLAVWGHADPVLPKPPYWAACNHCGMCCIHEPCWIGRMMFEVYEGECPALQWSAEGSSCGLMANPAEFMPVRVRIEGASRVKEAAKTLIGSGRGCGGGGKMNEKTSAALKILGLFKAWRAGKARRPAPLEEKAAKLHKLTLEIAAKERESATSEAKVRQASEQSKSARPARPEAIRRLLHVAVERED